MTKNSKIRFHFDWEDHWLNKLDAEKAARDIMHSSAGRMMSVETFFNDLSLYRWLASRKGCNKVDLVSVHVFHSDMVVFGLQAVYRSTYENGMTQEITAEKHVYASGFYAAGAFPPECSTLVLENDEYILKVTTSQGEVVDGVTFVTNRRTIAFGGSGGGIPEPECDTQPDKVLSRVIAFTGTKGGALERLGFFVEPLNWEIVRPFVLMRKLVDLNRAEVDRAKILQGNDQCTEIQRLMHSLTMDTSDDVFQHILSYLVFPSNDKCGNNKCLPQMDGTPLVVRVEPSVPLQFPAIW